MMNKDLIDFDKCKLGRKGYPGFDTKESVIIDNQYYLVKIGDELSIDKNPLKASVSASPFSEFIGCKIFDSVDIPVQETLMGVMGGKYAVACKDFVLNNVEYFKPEWQLREFAELENNVINSSERGRTPRLEHVEYVIRNHPILEGIRSEATERFWDTLVVDALIGNFDRHSGNWGYMVNLFAEEVHLAPVYDCGATLYPKIKNAKLFLLLENPQEIKSRTMEFPKATLLVEGKRVGYYELLVNSNHPDCMKALLRIKPRIDLAKINSIIKDTPGITLERSEFLQEMVSQRFNRIIIPGYQQAIKTLGNSRQVLIDNKKSRISSLDSRLSTAEGLSSTQKPAQHTRGGRGLSK
jgi:hypothetical protein